MSRSRFGGAVVVGWVVNQRACVSGTSSRRNTPRTMGLPWSATLSLRAPSKPSQAATIRWACAFRSASAFASAAFAAGSPASRRTRACASTIATNAVDESSSSRSIR
jgi:hypothetical protein